MKALPCQDSCCSKNLTGFTIHDRNHSDALLETFYADDIVQQRNFMAALGGSSPGIFASQAQTSEGDYEVENNSEHHLNHKDHSLCERQMSYDYHLHSANLLCVNLPTYESIIKHLPAEFYQLDKKQVRCTPSGNVLPIYIPGNKVAPTSVKTSRDSFLPPHGPAVHSPVSIGYGKEVGLDKQHQAVWDAELNCYYFLEHFRQTVYSEDPRPTCSVAKESTKQEEFVYTGHSGVDVVAPYEISKETSAVETAAKRVTNKAKKIVLSGRGCNGSSGNTGTKGEVGLKGADGVIGVIDDGEDGEDGNVGTEGGRGSDGGCGGRGTDLVVLVSGSQSKLQLSINSHCNRVVKFGGDECEEVVLVDCQGGDGGAGGSGGEGGAGGSGGDGGKGGEGGDGGHGGDGGPGALGGDGGMGGRGGSGGNCIIRTSDPSLLMLVEVNCAAGAVGKGGPGGAGGKGGRRGIGGGGGTLEARDGHKTSGGDRNDKRGMKGKPGSTGSRGSRGRNWDDGTQGMNGGLLWIIESSSGDLLHQSGYKYDAVVTSLNLSPPACGDNYEPNERLTISEVVVKNEGGLPLPEGTKLSFPTNETVRFEPITCQIPELLPGESFTVPIQFLGRIFDQSTPNMPGHFTGEARFSPLLQLLGRSFTSTLYKTLAVSYPVKLNFALSKKNIGIGEESILEVGIENTSSISSSGKRTVRSGSVKVRIHLDTFLVPLGVVCTNDREKTTDFQAYYNPRIPDSLWVEFMELQPLEVATFGIAFKVGDGARLCDICLWQCDLFYKGKLVEYMAQEVRVTPSYSLSGSDTNQSDMLMVTSKRISAAEFNLWQTIFDILGLNIDYWDSEWEPEDLASTETNGESAVNSLFRSHETSDTGCMDLPLLYAIYSGKAILYPYCNLEDISADDITTHFNSSPSNDSSLLLFLRPTIPKSLEDCYYDHTEHTTIFRHLCRCCDRISLSKDMNVGYHLVTPGTFVSAEVSIKKSEKRVLKKLEKEVQPHTVVMFSHGGGICQKSAIKYSYGSMDVRKCPIKRSSNFQCVSGLGGSMAAMANDDPLLTPKSKEFPLASRFGQVLLAVLASAPLESKFRILKNTGTDHLQASIKCYLPNGLFLTVKELAAIAVAQNIADEVLDCSASISRMKRLKEDVSSNRTFYSRNGVAPVINQMLSLLEEEVMDRVVLCDNSPASQYAAKEITRLCSSLRIPNLGGESRNSSLRPCGTECTLNSLPIFHQQSHANGHVNTSLTSQSCSEAPKRNGKQVHFCPHGKTLPPLKVLQDSVHVLRSHQLTVDDDCYNASRSSHQ